MPDQDTPKNPSKVGFSQTWKCPETGITYEFFMPTARAVIELKKSLKFELGADTVTINLMDVLPFIQGGKYVLPEPDLDTMTYSALQGLLMAYYSFLNRGAVEPTGGRAPDKGSR